MAQGRVDQIDIAGALRDHDARLRALEATPAGVGGIQFGGDDPPTYGPINEGDNLYIQTDQQTGPNGHGVEVQAINGDVLIQASSPDSGSGEIKLLTTTDDNSGIVVETQGDNNGGVTVETQGASSDGIALTQSAGTGTIAIANNGTGGIDVLSSSGAGGSSEITMNQGTLPSGFTGMEIAARRDTSGFGTSTTGAIYMHTVDTTGDDISTIELGPAATPLVALQVLSGGVGTAISIQPGIIQIGLGPSDPHTTYIGGGSGTPDDANNDAIVQVQGNLTFVEYSTEPSTPLTGTAQIYLYKSGGTAYLKAIFDNGTKAVLANS